MRNGALQRMEFLGLAWGRRHVPLLSWSSLKKNAVFAVTLANGVARYYYPYYSYYYLCAGTATNTTAVPQGAHGNTDIRDINRALSLTRTSVAIGGHRERRCAMCGSKIQGETTLRDPLFSFTCVVTPIQATRVLCPCRAENRLA